MRKAERHDRIQDLLRQADALEIGELQRVLGVSRETVRKDLDAMAAEGRITRTRGAAVRRTPGAERAYGERRAELTDQKREIAAAALEEVPRRGAIWLDYGTTTLALAEQLPMGAELVVATDAFPIATAAAARDLTVFVPGGTLRPGELSLSGPMAARNLATLRLDVGFFGCAGLDPVEGLTNHHLTEAATSEAALRRCGRVVVLADHTKLGARALHRSASVGEIDLLVTDSGSDPAVLARFVAAGVQVRTT